MRAILTAFALVAVMIATNVLGAPTDETGRIEADRIEADRILGVWTPGHGNARIQIVRTGDTYSGSIVWLRHEIDPVTGLPRRNTMSPDSSKTDEPLMGLGILQEFQYKGRNSWEDGRIYDPEKGKTYCGKMTLLDDDQLRLRGNICGLSLFGRNDTWTRYTGSVEHN